MSPERNQNPNHKREKLLHRIIPPLGIRAVREAYLDHASTQLLMDHRHLAKELGTHTEVRGLMSQPISREVMDNDGTVTYLLHGTSIEQAQRIIGEGLMLRKSPDNPRIPDLHRTTKMMPAKSEKAARARIEHGITYRFDVPSNNAKVVIRFDRPNPGTSLQEDQFRGTPLVATDDTSIVTNPDDKYPFRVPPERIMGYYDLDTGAFAPNPQFIDTASARPHQ